MHISSWLKHEPDWQTVTIDMLAAKVGVWPAVQMQAYDLEQIPFCALVFCRQLTPDLEPHTLQYYLLDIVNGTIEYDVVTNDPVADSNANMTVAGVFDSRCPQSKPFGIAHCVGHQHIGMALVALGPPALGHSQPESCIIWAS